MIIIAKLLDQDVTLHLVSQSGTKKNTFVDGDVHLRPRSYVIEDNSEGIALIRDLSSTIDTSSANQRLRDILRDEAVDHELVRLEAHPLNSLIIHSFTYVPKPHYK